MSNEEMYREIILDLYESPCNYGKLEDATCEKEGLNPLCGDKIILQLKIVEKLIEDVKFEGKGCAIHTASASLITDAIKGKSIEEVKQITKDDMLKLLVVPVGPARLKCALLAWDTVQKLIREINT